MNILNTIRLAVGLCAVSASIFGCAQSGSPEVDPAAAAKARENVGKADLSPPGMKDGAGR